MGRECGGFADKTASSYSLRYFGLCFRLQVSWTGQEPFAANVWRAHDKASRKLAHRLRLPASNFFHGLAP